MTNQKILICTDLDRTLIPNGDHPESPNTRVLFTQLVSDSQVNLAYVTGRDQGLVEDAIAEYNLPIPDFVIADVGANIYEIKNQKEWLKIHDWSSKISVNWQQKTQPDLVPFFEDLKECRLQENQKQKLHKLSYYVNLDADIQTLIKEIKLRLENIGIEANLIWSIDEQENVGLLDILPESANKKLAMEFLMNHQEFSLKNTVFSGDSGNDLDVLISPIKSILVANAHPELKKKITAEIAINKHLSNSLYLAQGNYLNLNGNYSAGILEGVNYYFPELINFNY